MMKRITLLVASVLALVSMGSLAHAKPSVAVLGLEVIDNGSVDKKATEAAQSLASELRAQASLSSSSFKLAPGGAKDLLELKMLSGCGGESHACMASIGKELGADRLLYGKLERSKNGYLVSLKLLNTNTKQMEKTTSELIPMEDLHGSEIGRWARSLYARLTGMPEAGTLRLDANVDKATVYVDGKVVTTLRDGSAKVEGLDEGVHDVAIEAEGYKRYQADVAITAGETESLSVSLLKVSGGGGGGGEDEGPSNTWKYSFYAGVVLTATAGGMWTFYGLQSGNLGGGGYLDDKNSAWDALQDSDPGTAGLIADGMTGTISNACGQTGNVTGTVVGNNTANSDFQAFKSACDSGESAAKLALYSGIGTGVFALATAYFGYQAYFSANSSGKERMAGKKKSKERSKIVVMPQISPESVGAGLALEF